MDLWAVWLILFIVGCVPGSIFGYALVKLPLSRGWLLFLIAYLSALGSYLLSLAVVPTEQATVSVHGLNIALFAPPTFAATLFYIYWIRREKVSSRS